MLDLLADVVAPSRWFLAAAAVGRAEAPEVLAAHRGGTACATPAEALARARDAAGEAAVTLVCGSIHVVAPARAALLGIDEDPRIAL